MSYTAEELDILEQAKKIQQKKAEANSRAAKLGHIFVPGYGQIKIEKLRPEHKKALEGGTE